MARRPGQRPGQLNPTIIESHANGAAPPSSASGALAWRLGQGRTIGEADRVELGISPATMSATVAALRRRGWIIQTTPGSKHDGSGTSYVVERRATSVPAVAADTLHADTANGNGNGATAKRRAERIELDQYRALHAPAPAAPAVGTVLRATMVAEDGGAAVMALRDRDGSTWFVRVEGAGK